VNGAYDKRLARPDFLLLFEKTSDPWERSRLVGQKISELRDSFRAMSEEQHAELVKQGEVELKDGLEVMDRHKKAIRDLIALVDAFTTHGGALPCPDIRSLFFPRKQNLRSRTSISPFLS
jgi:hypothetical protein